MWSDLVKRFLFLCLLLFAFAVLGWVAGIWAEPTSGTNLPPLNPSTPATVSKQTQSLQDLETAWSALKNELMQSESDWQRVSELLLALQIEIKELRGSLKLSTEQLQSLKQSSQAEREAMQSALVISKRNTVIAQIVACLAALAALMGWIL